MNADTAAVPGALERLSAVLGAEHVVTDPVERRFYSTDIYNEGPPALAVLRPQNAEQVVEIVRIALEYRLPLVPRGGGASYTDAYVPAEPNALAIDTSRMNRILEINERDMYVVVQAGVTWAQLNEALQARGLRTPFYGPFSGIAATVGGSLSQNSVTWGTGVFGISGETPLGVEVVLGTGELIRTGSWGAANSVPFLRSYGPDLTGLFMGDCGAFGIKTAISLRLMRRNEHVLGLSFGFPDFESLAAGMEAAAKEGLNLTNFGLDPTLQQGQLGKADAATAWQSALAVWRTSRNAFDGARQVLKMALAGRSFLKGAVFSAHWLVDGIDAASCRSAVARLRRVLQPHGAEVPPTVPTVVHAMPFMPLYNVRSPLGERWVPIHGILPFSRVLDFRRDLMSYYAAHEHRMQQLRVRYGGMFMTIGTNAFLYEPVFYWHDVTNITQERLLPEGYLATLPKFEENLPGRRLVDEMKHGIAELFHKHGAAHLQIGKFYPYLRGRHEHTAKIVRELKKWLDPERRM
ncbi:MAG: FAD-binding oxidoreductase, partial [Steroidobacteraceae bacterium]|nr:FAD-binding oxidoreductase [Steroidobacteraceae bacterium]